MKTYQKNIFLFVIIVLFVIFLTPYFGSLYEKIIGHNVSASFWGPGNPEYIPGFMMSFVFVNVFFFAIFKKPIKYSLIALGVVLFIDISIGSWVDGVFIDIVLAILAFCFAKLIIFLKSFVKI